MSTLEKSERSSKEHYSDFAKSSLYRYIPQSSSYIPEGDENKSLAEWSNNYGTDILMQSSDPTLKREMVSSVHYLRPFLFNSKPNSDLEEVINEAKYIPLLEYNWDEEGAIPIPQDLFDVTIHFLKHYYLFLLDSIGVNIALPEINPCRDGTIDLSWRTKNARLLINVRSGPDDYMAYFYGDLYNNKMPLKGNFCISKFSEPLAFWMKYLV
ncbi:MAG: hypothetical protein WKG06_43825 [Segetibacter sp.]